MVEEILPGLYRMEIPLPNNPLKAVNSYVIKSPGRNLVIDTGMNREECVTAIQAGLGELGIDLRETDFFITHMHADHSGLVAALAGENSRIYCSGTDSVMVNPEMSPEAPWLKEILSFALLNGFPENVLQEALMMHPGFRYCARGRLAFCIVREGDTINIGEYVLKCVETPGHTPGHICLYDPRKKILFSGDHILGDITPNISLWSDDQNPLREYFESLDKVGSLAIDLVLPGHRSLIKDCRGRIEELKAHHLKRAEEILAIVGERAMDAYQVAARMSWDLTYESWDLFPPPQKWFAAAEAIAHLKYLEDEQLIQRKTDGHKVLFAAIKNGFSS
ncbi:MAG: MBL fold metallo-hydrolase [Peptococcaceae bacterium]|nr:MBL fold metallo-hydrolase [Peptococcaceae bacterium]